MAIYAYSCTETGETAGANPRDAQRFEDEAALGQLPRLRAPRFREMMHRLRAGDTVLVATLRDVGCDARDVLITLGALDEARVEVFVLALGQVSLTSETGRLMRKMLEAAIEMEKQRPPNPIRKRGHASRGAPRLSRELRAQIVTEYSQGKSVAELADRYGISRTSLRGIVDPKRNEDEPLPFAWGD